MHDNLDNALKSTGLKGLHAECLTDIWIGRERYAVTFLFICESRLEWAILLIRALFPGLLLLI
jgi:hypothetical protein